MNLELRDASRDERDQLESLLREYLDELGAIDGSAPPEEYPYLPLYWKEATRWPFLLGVSGRTVGFALVRRHDDGNGGCYEMAEFYVVPERRREGLGTQAATALFDRFPGRWRVRQQAKNRAARRFWRSVVGEYTSGRFEEVEGEAGTQQHFSSGPPSP